LINNIHSVILEMHFKSQI